MAEIRSILAAITSRLESRTREFLRGPRIVPAGRDRVADATDAGAPRASGLQLRLLRVRGAARALSEMGSGGQAPGVLVSSSRRGAVGVEAVGGSRRTSSATFVVSVSRLAAAQVNQGTVADRGAVNTIDPGTNSFTVSVGTGPARTVSFTNDSTDSNVEAFERVARAINDADVGVSAAVVEDEDAETVRIELTARATGVRNAFAIADVTGNVVSTAGIATTTTAAADAAFIVNGVPRGSSANTVLIDHGRLQLTLGAETGPGTADDVGVLISARPDPTSGAVIELARSLNSLRAFLETDGSSGLQRLLYEVDGLVAERQPDLEAIGVFVVSGGRLEVETTLLESIVVPAGAPIAAGGGDLGSHLAALAERALGDSQLLRWRGALGAGGSLGGRALVSDAGGERGVLLDVLS